MTSASARLTAALAGRYTIERELGSGGMATVYLAHDLRHERDVAIKVLRADIAQTLGAERFLREIRLAAKLNHPHILPLFDSGDADGALYYVMPAVEGLSLRDRLLHNAVLPVDEAVRIATAVADALDHAHRHGVLHRDIKPENILLQDGHALVADFGIGKALSSVEGEAFTQTGVGIGTPAYMSPEQAAGDAVDGRSDIYSLGCVLYEMLVGEQPFTGPTVQAVIAKRFVQTPADVAALREGVPRSVADAVQCALARAPTDRHETGARFLSALEEAGSASETVLQVPDASVAVVPFTNMSPDRDNEYFSDGITDDIIVALTQVSGLKVAARTSSFAFKGNDAALGVIGKSLGVRTVLQGSVRRVGNRVRVTAQLMNAAEGVQLWGARYDRDLDDIFAIQDEIARGIVTQLEVALGLRHATAQLVARPTRDIDTYQLYLRGREAAYQRSPASLRQAIEYFRQVLVRDPGYARAHIGLAEANIGLGVYQYIPTIDAARAAEASLLAAERLQPDLPLVHVLWGQLKLFLRPDWHTAGPHLVRALAIDPDEPLAHAYTAFLNGMLGNLEACRAAAARAVALDPLSVFIRVVAAMGFPRVGIAGCDAAAALAAHESALAMDPNAVVHLWMSALRLGDFGRHEEAVQRMTRAVALTQRGPFVVGMYARVLALAGRRDEALALRAELRERARSEYVGPGAMLMMAVLDVDDEDATAALLEAAVDGMVGPTTIFTTVVCDLEPLLNHPRLGALVRRLSPWATWPGRHLAVSA